MPNPATVAQGGWLPRFAARGVAICIAVVAHVAVLLALAYDPGKLVVDESSGPISVEIVVAPSNDQASAAPLQAAAAGPTLRLATPSPQPIIADERPREKAERRDEDPPAMPTPRSKLAATRKLVAPHVRRAANSAPARTSMQGMESLGVSGSGGANGIDTVPVGVPSIWKARLLSHLDRHKRYPSTARAKGVQGTVLLSFGMDRDGRVLEYYLVRSSGYPELDDEAFAMITRASPLPPAPPGINAQVVQLVVPVRFRM